MGWIEEVGWDRWSFGTNDVIGLIVVYAMIAAVFGLYLLAKKRWTMVDPRKIVHIGVGQFIWIWWIFSTPWVMLAFFTLPFTIILFFAMFDNNPIGRSKLGEISREGHKTGLFFYALAITILVLLCFNHWLAATIGVVAMTFGDGFGSIIGKKYGKHKTIRGKSWEGTIAVFLSTAIVSTVVIIFYSWLISQGIATSMNTTPVIDWWWTPIIAGLVACVAETVCSGDYDNIILACVVTLVMIVVGF